ncbi:HI0074 family nucleotidyltransferase substrate-binding subunit [Saliterribacillus persicus]|uniref:Nucleotidyltransferase substrate binding protein (TIGR01987 family) n=1 Tax=Saliterribacillus persicus TaxID=930114 RepID=A0A368Y9X5_9BACI|nr:HI0074 family nucleotidyltransferase substrate-binding subunit [Saliterribacillus persicus]RCW74994.1 nucleotidyltransferase substrate binding protein (TIGR01987 family) [Saliterribacillus persicus]
MEEDRKLKQSVRNLEKSLLRLEEALNDDHDNSLIVDGTIQRFEFTIEFYWKTLKGLLQAEGIEAKTPKETLKEAFQVGWLENEKAWLQMLRDRNETSHAYNEELALQIVKNIQGYFPEMKQTFFNLREKGKL